MLGGVAEGSSIGACGENGLVVIGAHPPGSDPEAIEKVMKEFAIAYPVCIDGPAGTPRGALYSRLAVRAIPHAVAVDDQGKVVASGPLQDVLSRARELVRKD